MKASQLIIAAVFFALGAVFALWQTGWWDQARQQGTDQTKLMLETPDANSVITSPLRISGKMRGTWFFEASAPIELQDDDGEVIATGIAQAQGEWMTTDFVDFTSTITFNKPAVSTGWLVFKKDNPSGLPENDDSVKLPIKFE